ncbi:uncharacterized protein LOC122306540 [Carya illinoinensis]|uniref:Uncharacterized protein n=1 Tax=Carya illinoinensis TaxID=32201 RepID=A0A8T1RHN7_CARIL|nr:uncharacterized protein LOC122306540 [Carya illinoinensis]KAG6666386.1 hypothetical protein CIPAW_01G028300 [Carya illinoinensis]KAG6729422.1 hypothetical protein I3842_01G029100 [Carya illinoinensis]
MSSDREGSDSDAPEEFTADQGRQLLSEIRKVEKENKARVVREGKERRRLWAQKLTPRPSRKGEIVQDEVGDETQQESKGNEGMLPDDIVKVIVAREKIVFSSDSEEEKTEVNPTKRKKKSKTSGVEPVILKDMGPSQCLQNSLEFLKNRKMQVPRSSAVLNNSSQALRLLSSSGLICKK